MVAVDDDGVHNFKVHEGEGEDENARREDREHDSDERTLAPFELSRLHATNEP